MLRHISPAPLLLIGLEQMKGIAIVSNPSAALAQLVEHLIRNERVAGSNPASGSITPLGVDEPPESNRGLIAALAPASSALRAELRSGYPVLMRVSAAQVVIAKGRVLPALSFRY